jgi:hypothetical protein
MYGTASAPFLATRCLKQLGHECEQWYPKTAAIVCQDLYVDEILSGYANVQEFQQLQEETSTRSWIPTVEMVFDQQRVPSNHS